MYSARYYLYRFAIFTIAVLALAATLLLDLSNGARLWVEASPALPNNSVTPLPTSTRGSPTVTRTPTNTRTPTSTRTPLPTPGPCGDWRHFPVPVGRGRTDFLRDVDAVSANDVWAVGDQGDADYESLIQRWTGQSWEIVTSPISMTLQGVSAIASNDVWAVGYTGSLGGQRSESRTLHWDGSSWTIVPSPNITGSSNYLYGVAAAGPNDVWAVGLANSQSLTMHWDGAQWTIVPVPDPTGYALYDVAIAGPNDVWAVGVRGYETFIVHWDGATWTHVPSPNPGTYDNDLEAVTAIAPDDIWAVGALANGPVDYHALILHWDGTSWESVPAPGNGEQPLTYGVHLHGVDAASSSEVWAVGRDYIASDTMSVILRWDGTSWAEVSHPQPSRLINRLFGVTAVAPGEAWAVGTHWMDGTGDYRGLAQRYGPPCGSATPTATGSPSTATSTRTAIASVTATSAPIGSSTPTATASQPSTTPLATGTAAPTTSTATALVTVTGIATVTTMATATTPFATSISTSATVLPTLTPTAIPTLAACNIQFSDVLPGNPFYDQIMCLSCMGMTGGYVDGTFRPYNEVTRGQLAKLVSNTAGFSDVEALTSQSFQDVPIGNTFYVYIERMAVRGIIAGYPCGGAGEPCGLDNLPYFRPGANATRGQISKIVSNAAGLNNTPTSQTFEDVPPGHAFYVWVERLASHGMMGGYPCGGTGEACSAANRPYFRPQANATRGQVIKILGNGFYPGCNPIAER